MKFSNIIPLAVLVLLTGFINHVQATQTDPLDSPSWASMHETILGNEPVVFDDRIILQTPAFAEDPMNVPLTVDASALDDVVEIRIFADLNPIREILYFRPGKLSPYIALRFKVEQMTPVRAAVKTTDGVWHVAGHWLEASGGGCTAPGNGRVSGDWFEDLMQVSWHSWVNDGQADRLRLRVMHPMDTGLAPGIPAFYIERLAISQADGTVLAEIDSFEPVSEDPVFSFRLPEQVLSTGLQVTGRDNNGNTLEANIQ